MDEHVPEPVGPAGLETSTWFAGSSESRLASTLPADPPPTMMKSNRRAMAVRAAQPDPERISTVCSSVRVSIG